MLLAPGASAEEENLKCGDWVSGYSADSNHRVDVRLCASPLTASTAGKIKVRVEFGNFQKFDSVNWVADTGSHTAGANLSVKPAAGDPIVATLNGTFVGAAGNTELSTLPATDPGMKPGLATLNADVEVTSADAAQSVSASVKSDVVVL
ncbi:hypothetical protein GCM10010452_24720 [Crossiella cryophila]